MRIIKSSNAIRERTYLVLIDIFILMCAMGVSLGILFITISPDFGLAENKQGLAYNVLHETKITVEQYDRLRVGMNMFKDHASMVDSIKHQKIQPVAMDSNKNSLFHAGYKLNREELLVQLEVDSAENIFGELNLELSDLYPVDLANRKPNDSILIRATYKKGVVVTNTKGYEAWHH